MQIYPISYLVHLFECRRIITVGWLCDFPFTWNDVLNVTVKFLILLVPYIKLTRTKALCGQDCFWNKCWLSRRMWQSITGNYSRSEPYVVESRNRHRSIKSPPWKHGIIISMALNFSNSDIALHNELQGKSQSITKFQKGLWLCSLSTFIQQLCKSLLVIHS